MYGIQNGVQYRAYQPPAPVLSAKSLRTERVETKWTPQAKRVMFDQQRLFSAITHVLARETYDMLGGAREATELR